MTLINSQFGRCDSHCYLAAHERCECVCGGRNHGRGRGRAEKTVRELAGQMAKNLKRQHPGAMIEVPANQMELF